MRFFFVRIMRVSTVLMCLPIVLRIQVWFNLIQSIKSHTVNPGAASIYKVPTTQAGLCALLHSHHVLS